MRDDTLYLKYKYQYCLKISRVERNAFLQPFYNIHILSTYNNDTFSYYNNSAEMYTIFQDYVLYKHVEIMKAWHYYLSYQMRLVNEFNRKKKILKKLAYMNILKNLFCNDICGEIVSFIV